MRNLGGFRDKKVLITGHSGFKGTWLSWMLSSLGADVTGISLGIPTTPSHFELSNLRACLTSFWQDITHAPSLSQLITELQPDFIFHLAAQSLVSESYKDPERTFSTNFVGTLHLLEALRALTRPVSAVLITSDKAYENQEWCWSYRENDRLGGHDPYSASKAATEFAISSYAKSFFQDGSQVRIAVARAGNVIGGGDWSKDRLVPDCIRSWTTHQSVRIRSHQATRPWQHVLEPLNGYLQLALELEENNSLNGEAFNFGPSTSRPRTVGEVVSGLAIRWPGARYILESESSGFHETSLLQLNWEKAASYLGWQPLLNFDDTLDLTADWYQSANKSPEYMREVTLNQIDQYFRKLEDFLEQQ